MQQRRTEVLRELENTGTSNLSTTELIQMIRDRYSAASISYLYFNLYHSTCKEDTVYRSSNLDWQHAYNEENLFKVDPSVKLAYSRLIPLDWSTIDVDSNAGLSYFESAKKSSIGSQGLTFFIHGDHGNISLFTLRTNHKKVDWHAYKEESTCDLQMIFMYFYETVIKRHESQHINKKSDLSDREIECLNWYSKGKSYWEISVILEISERTVNFHMTSARNKLNAVTNAQAVAIGILGGIILSTSWNH